MIASRSGSVFSSGKCRIRWSKKRNKWRPRSSCTDIFICGSMINSTRIGTIWKMHTITPLTTWQSLDWYSTRFTHMGKTSIFDFYLTNISSHVHWILFDVLNTSSQSISFYLTSFEFTCMVINHVFDVLILLPCSCCFRSVIFYSTCIVIDQYLRVSFILVISLFFVSMSLFLIWIT